MAAHRQNADPRPLADRPIRLIGAPVEEGAPSRGAIMGPAALRTAGLLETLEALGIAARDAGDLTPERLAPDDVAALAPLSAAGVRAAPTIAGWTRSIARAVSAALDDGDRPVLLGGDHSVAMGSVAAAAAHARAVGRPLLVVWLDAHADFNTPETSPSGALHGMGLAAACGLPGFDGVYGEAPSGPADPRAVHMLGVRSVDPGERALLRRHGVQVGDMRALDEVGVSALTRTALERADAENALIHVSLDVDFLDPDIAPGVGTTAPGGATFREAHLVMELLHESGRVASLDLVELNPFLDERGRSARLLVDLAASLFGKHIIERPTRTRWSA